MEQSQSVFLNEQKQASPGKLHYILFAAVAVLCFFLFNHPDIIETSRHSYILLRSTFDGNFFDFYQDVLSRTYGYVYTNAAHYSIIMYLLYALWELPLYLLESIFGFACSDLFLSLWCKLLNVLFYLGCGLAAEKAGKKLSVSPALCGWIPLLFWLNPISFFTTLVMGQYDCICLFFILAGICFFLDRRLLAFSLVIGVGITFKFFSLFIFVPLLLLAEKRPLRILGYGFASLWLYLPSSLLFLGRTGDASHFTFEMIDRMFVHLINTSMLQPAWIPVLILLLFFGIYLYHPKDEAALFRAVAYLPLAALSILFLFVFWHPQWMILIIPFFILTQLQQQEKSAWVYLDIAFSIGFFFTLYHTFPRALEANLFDLGILREITGHCYFTTPPIAYCGDFFFRIPYALALTSVLFCGALLCGLIFKFPWGEKSLSDRLCQKSLTEYRPAWAMWGTFATGFLLFWLLPVLICYCIPFFG